MIIWKRLLFLLNWMARFDYTLHSRDIMFLCVQMSIIWKNSLSILLLRTVVYPDFWVRGWGERSKLKKCKTKEVRGWSFLKFWKFNTKFSSKNLIIWSHFLRKIFIKCTAFHWKQADSYKNKKIISRGLKPPPPLRTPLAST